jgi:proprotein convertase subtilisin/kexin type 5
MTTKSICYSCNTTISFWYNFDCYNPCPTGTFANSPNCTQCDASCAVCTNTPSPCTICNTGYKLSGTVCSTTCLPQYGSTTNSSLCVLCDVKCTVCFEISTNCSACTPTAPNEAFLLGTQCLTTCPTGYAALTTTHVCLVCQDNNCTSCNPLDTTQCYQCVSPFYWYNYDCLAVCPVGTFTNTPNCTDCDASCAVCTNTPSPCTICNTGYKLSGTVCSTTCLPQYGSTTNSSLCVLCDLKCTVCFEISTNCSACTPTAPNEAFLLGTQCLTTCPTGYAALTTTHVCLVCQDNNCTSCNPLDTTQCYQCVSPFYWYNYDCLAVCPVGTFTNTPNCTDCDASCAVCTNTPSPCTICNTGYKLSGTVCSTTCLPQYGSTTNSSLCVLCDVKCTVCFEISTNCSACTPTAPNEAFLLGTQCLTTCPTNYTAVLATHTC